MKGTLTKTEQGWMVKYTVDYTWDASLPLHPQDAEVQRMLGWEGKEVEFEIVNEAYEDGKGCTYAKLINQVSDNSKMVEDDVEKLAEQEFPTGTFENMEKYDDRNRLRQQGYIKGYNKAKETLYTEEQVIAAIEDARDYTGYVNTDEVIKSLKQPKKD